MCVPPPRYVWFDNSVPNPKLVAITHLLIDQHTGMSAAEKAKVKGWLILQQRVEASAPVRVRVPLPAPPAVAPFLEYPSPILSLAVAAAPTLAPLGSQAGEAFTEAELRQIESLAEVAPRRLSFVEDDEDVDLDAVMRDINTSLRDLGDITSFPSAPSIRVYDRRPRIVATAREIDEISPDMAGLPLFESLARKKAAVSERMLTDKDAEYNWFPSFDDDGVDTPLLSSAAAGAAGGDGAAGGSWAAAGGAAAGGDGAAGGAAAGGAAGGGGGLGADEEGDDGDEIRIDLSNLSIEEPSPAPSLLGAAMTIYEEDNDADADADADADDDDVVLVVGTSVATPSGVRRSRVSFTDSPPRIIGHSVAEGRDAGDAIMLVDLSPPHKRNRPKSG
jgi:hypothetical protein